MKLWIGTEIEGKHIGLNTLFVGSYDVEYVKIIETIKETNIEQIYFGAGMLGSINWKQVEFFEKKYPNIIITVEVDLKTFDKVSSDILMNPRIEFILTYTNNAFSLLESMNKNRIQIKFQSLVTPKILGITSAANFNYVNMTKHVGKTYEDDKVIL